MYTLIRSLPIKRLLYEQTPALALAWAATEIFYKFHSFTLECAAFLATWFIFDLLIQVIVGRLVRPVGESQR